MLRYLLPVLLAALSISQAHAAALTKTNCQTSSAYQTGQPNDQAVDIEGNTCVRARIVPDPVRVQGVFTANTTSTTLASAAVTLSPGSAAFPSGALPNGTLEIQNQGSSRVTACWLGSPCTVGQTIDAGERVTVALPNFATAPPSFIATGASAVLGFKM
jgi:hypothetical protein